MNESMLVGGDCRECGVRHQPGERCPKAPAMMPEPATCGKCRVATCGPGPCSCPQEIVPCPKHASVDALLEALGKVQGEIRRALVSPMNDHGRMALLVADQTIKDASAAIATAEPQPVQEGEGCSHAAGNCTKCLSCGECSEDIDDCNICPDATKEQSNIRT